MGKFSYATSTSVEIEDRALAHLQIVIGAKLRRGEAFYFTWRDDVSVGDGRTSVWLQTGIPVVFKFYGSRRPQINGAWVDALTYTANGIGGLHMVPEPADDTVAATAPAAL